MVDTEVDTGPVVVLLMVLDTEVVQPMVPDMEAVPLRDPDMEAVPLKDPDTEVVLLLATGLVVLTDPKVVLDMAVHL